MKFSSTEKISMYTRRTLEPPARSLQLVREIFVSILIKTAFYNKSNLIKKKKNQLTCKLRSKKRKKIAELGFPERKSTLHLGGMEEHTNVQMFFFFFPKTTVSTRKWTLEKKKKEEEAHCTDTDRRRSNDQSR